MTAGQAPQLDQLKALLDQQNAVLDKSKQIMESIFDKGMTYSKVIIGIGYGGLIAVWSGTHQYLSPRHAMLSGFLFVLSLCAYAIFEIINMFYLVWLPFAFKKEVKSCGTNFALALTNFEATQEKATRRLLKAWAVALVLTIPTGFGAAGILIWGFMRQF